MIYVEFLKNLTDEQMLQIIDDIRVLNEETGQVPETSLIKTVAKIRSEEYKRPYDLKLGLDAINQEIMERYREILIKK